MTFSKTRTRAAVPQREGSAAHRWRWVLLLAVLTILGAYAFVDRPLAIYIHAQDWRRYGWLERSTHLCDALVAMAVVIGLAQVLGLGGRLPGRRVLNPMALAVALGSFLKEGLKYAFSRAWPETWTHHNPSFIGNQVYGFFWFQPGDAYRSFPSGNATVVFAAVTVLWLAAPRWRWLCMVACVAVCLGLLGMNYHFLSDLIAGGLLGAGCGAWVWECLNMQEGT
jgi:membrane-associated phospholipid phosphatase